MNSRIHLSLPHMGGHELNYVSKAFEDNWVSTVGPNVKAFEQELCDYTGAGQAVVLSSGTAAIHLALLGLGIGPGDEVFCSSFTFAATANPIVYVGAQPVFIDSESETWNMCPVLLRQAIQESAAKGKLPKAILVVHLYGMPAQLNQIIEIAAEYGIPVIEDAAEALGSTYHKKFLGTLTAAGILSFNGNKIITTSGGGALLTDNEKLAQQARFLSTQAKDPAPHYQHSQIGFNYALSNISAGIGRGQMGVIEKRVKQRREIFAFYKEALKANPHISFQPEPEGSASNRWLTCILIDLASGVTPEIMRKALEQENIESRPLWKPLHLQPVFENANKHCNGVSERLFNTGLCLPSGSNLTEDELERVVQVIRKVFGNNRVSILNQLQS